jgi:hypothetical protein
MGQLSVVGEAPGSLRVTFVFAQHVVEEFGNGPCNRRKNDHEYPYKCRARSTDS